MLTLAPTTGAPPAPVTWPLMVVPCACANAGTDPSTTADIARKREILPVIPIQHLAESETGMRLSRTGRHSRSAPGSDYVAAPVGSRGVEQPLRARPCGRHPCRA